MSDYKPAGYPTVRKPAGAAGVRSRVVAVRLTDLEWDDLNEQRKSLSRSEYLRLLLLRDRKARAGVETP